MCLSDNEFPHNRTDASEVEETLMHPDRRAVLEKLGTLAAWTPPVMLTLMLSPRDSAASAGAPPPPPGGPGFAGS